MKINLLDIPAYYINLPEQVDRNNSALEALTNLGFKNIIRVDGVRDPKANIVGLSKANHNILSTAKAPFIIFEDDIEVRDFVAEIDVPDDIDALYLGNTSWSVQDSYHGHFLRYTQSKAHSHLYRIYNMLCAHAILYLSDRYVDVCERTSYYCGYVSPWPVDVPFAEIQKYYNVYTTDKPMFVQRLFDSRMSDTPTSTWKNLTKINNKQSSNIDGRKVRHDPFLIDLNPIDHNSI